MKIVWSNYAPRAFRGRLLNLMTAGTQIDLFTVRENLTVGVGAGTRLQLPYFPKTSSNESCFRPIFRRVMCLLRPEMILALMTSLTELESCSARRIDALLTLGKARQLVLHQAQLCPKLAKSVNARSVRRFHRGFWRI